MKIIIVGGGVSGLSLYLHLRNTLPSWSSHTVRIFESHPRDRAANANGVSTATPVTTDLTDSTAVIGNSIALTPHGMRLLKSIDPRVYDSFKARGYVNRTYKFQTARGHVLAVIPTADPRHPDEHTVSCPRFVLQECLLDAVGAETIQHAKVVEVELREGRRPLVRLADGRAEHADLVVGADGAHSVVKKALFNAGSGGQSFSPRYEGFCGVGGFVDADVPAGVTGEQCMVFTFGPAGSFGYCSAAPEAGRKIGWWSNWGTPNRPTSSFMDSAEIQKQLRDRHERYRDPVIGHCVESATTDRIYPIWTTPNLPHWGERGAVLLGDAAHTLQATSGQGAGQALEDSVTFGTLLSRLIDTSSRSDSDLTIADCIGAATKGLYQIRNPRVSDIRTRAQNLYLSRSRIRSVLVEYAYYLYLFLCFRYPILGQLIIGTVFNDDIEWDIHDQVQLYVDRHRL